MLHNDQVEDIEDIENIEDIGQTNNKRKHSGGPIRSKSFKQRIEASIEKETETERAKTCPITRKNPVRDGADVVIHSSTLFSLSRDLGKIQVSSENKESNYSLKKK